MFMNVLCIALALVATPQVFGEAVKETQPIHVGDIFDNAWALHEDLSTAVNNSIDTHLPQVRLLSERIAATGDAILASARVTIDEQALVFDAQVTAAQEEAESSGMNQEDIDYCVAVFKIELALLPTIVVNEIRNCLNVTVTEGQQMAELSAYQIEATQTVVAGIGLHIQECELLPDGTECVARVIQQISIELTDLPARIKEDTDKCVAVIDALEGTLNVCFEDRKESVPTVGADIIVELRTCLNLD